MRGPADGKTCPQMTQVFADERQYTETRKTPLSFALSYVFDCVNGANLWVGLLFE
jgi:hypothetical protein